MARRWLATHKRASSACSIFSATARSGRARRPGIHRITWRTWSMPACANSNSHRRSGSAQSVFILVSEPGNAIPASAFGLLARQEPAPRAVGAHPSSETSKRPGGTSAKSAVLPRLAQMRSGVGRTCQKSRCIRVEVHLAPRRTRQRLAHSPDRHPHSRQKRGRARTRGSSQEGRTVASGFRLVERTSLRDASAFLQILALWSPQLLQRAAESREQKTQQSAATRTRPSV